jgi:segregation and condensation protein A
MSYKVELAAFAGPMDLLLYLIRQNEVDIYDIPIATIAGQFVSYIELMEELDIEYAAEFLLMAATLMDIKARTLVPQVIEGEEEAEEELIDPREELVKELLEYKKFHDAALYLGERYDDRNRRFESGADHIGADEKSLEEVEVWDLFSAFGALLKQIGARGVEIAATELPISAYMEMITDRLEGERQVAFTSLFEGLPNRLALVGMFIALLELVRLQRLRALQSEDFGEIIIELREDGAGGNGNGAVQGA